MSLGTQAGKDSCRFVSMLGSEGLPLWKQNLKTNDVQNDVGLL